ncbi:fucose 4-O-acetylase [Paenibacillus sp. SYP-B3998]|uniref:Fucose 4-O-acetylase n=1 Tax=Paenibacillus sp. SYP-B3998 TaxID=2678564 RepID=A0A6G3ZVW7_9BACL|nr:acyltransferase family protein [Paenibacillus sp. SYP-B3998]NEW05739.1 fucose 4-O-acetylase [Paenibacillus sp. SYP-B3998]
MGRQNHGASDTYMLNTRFLLIVCVVIANCIEPLIQQSTVMKTLYLIIYTFHIPLFVFVTGYFAKSFQFDYQGVKLLQIIFYQYVIFQSLYSLMDAWVYHAPNVHYSFFIPYSLLWFLFSHICWRFLLPLFKTFKHPIVVAIIIGVLIGYLPFTGLTLSFSRTLVFFPFFLFGYYYQDDHLTGFILAFRKFSGIILLCLVTIVVLFPLDPKWLYSSYTYQELGQFSWYAGGYRIVIYALQAISCLCFLSMFPRMPSILTDWGRYTVYVFLLHGLIIKTVIASGLFAHLFNPLQMGIVIVSACLLTWVLTQSWARKLSRPLIEPKLTYWERYMTKKGMI